MLVAAFWRNLLWGAAGTWRDVGHAGLRPGQGSPCVYRCLLLIKARSIWPVETNSLSFALFQKFLPCLKHDFFFSFLALNFIVGRYATDHAWKWNAPSTSKCCYKKKELSPGQIHFSKWWGWCKMKVVLKSLAPRGLKRCKLKRKNYKQHCHLQLQKLLHGQNHWQNEADDGCSSSSSTFLLCGLFPSISKNSLLGGWNSRLPKGLWLPTQQCLVWREC